MDPTGSDLYKEIRSIISNLKQLNRDAWSNDTSVDDKKVQECVTDIKDKLQKWYSRPNSKLQESDSYIIESLSLCCELVNKAYGALSGCKADIGELKKHKEQLEIKCNLLAHSRLMMMGQMVSEIDEEIIARVTEGLDRTKWPRISEAISCSLIDKKIRKGELRNVCGTDSIEVSRRWRELMTEVHFKKGHFILIGKIKGRRITDAHPTVVTEVMREEVQKGITGILCSHQDKKFFEDLILTFENLRFR